MTTTTTSEKMYDLKEAAVYLGCNEMYTRKLVSSGKIASVKVPTKVGSATMKYLVAESALDEWKNASRKGSARSDGRNKWIVYASKEEILKVNELCEQLGLPQPFMPNEGVYEKRKAMKA